MDGKIGYDIVRLLTQCESIDELNENYRIVNHCYPVLLEQLKIKEEIENNQVIID